MYSSQKAQNKSQPRNPQAETKPRSKSPGPSAANELMPLGEFLHHFYQVMSRYVKTEEDLSKVFNLYAIETKKTKLEVDGFRKAYVDSLNHFALGDPEVRHCMSLLKKDDKGAIDFLMKGKRKILLFFDIGESNMGYPLAEVVVRIAEWINLLKSFSFFGSENLSKKVEQFKQFVIEINENFLEVNAAEFLQAVYIFSIHLQDQELAEVQNDRKATSRATFHRDRSADKFGMQLNSFENKGLNIGKTAQRFAEKTPVVLPVKSGREDQSLLTSLHRSQADHTERVSGKQQATHGFSLRNR